MTGRTQGLSRGRRILLGTAALAVAAAIWLPSVHLFYAAGAGRVLRAEGLSPKSRRLARRQLDIWTAAESDRAEILRMRAVNPEWDLMGRSFVAWSLANAALRQPAEKGRALEAMDRIIADTLRLEAERGVYHFLMPYARRKPFVMQPARSLFLDGEIALMLAARRIVEEKPEYKPLLTQRVNAMVERMGQGPVLSAESYPEECWTFCNTVALAAIRAADFVDGTDHSDFLRRWVQTAKAKLVDPNTGLLVSSYTLAGTPIDGPEGSSIWMAVHCLDLIDEQFAADQYRRAKGQLADSFLGFGYAREWPGSWVGPMDIDSATVIPAVGVSVSSSGLAMIAAATFRDEPLYCSLTGSLELAGFPQARRGRLKYCAGNQVGDAVVLYSTVLGPLWDRIKRGERP